MATTADWGRKSVVQAGHRAIRASRVSYAVFAVGVVLAYLVTYG